MFRKKKAGDAAGKGAVAGEAGRKKGPEKGKDGGGGRRFPLWLWMVAAFVVLVISGMILAFFLFRETPPPEPDVTLTLPDTPDRIPGLWQPPVMEISLRVDGETRLPLRLGIAILAAEGPDGMMRLLQHQEAILSSVRDHVEKGRAEDWESVAGKLRLKYALTRLVNGIAGTPVKGLYITDYMILWPI